MDSTHRNPTGHATTSLSAKVFGKLLGDRSRYNGKIVFHLGSVNTAPNAMVIHGVSSNGLPQGIDIGFRCNKLHLDTSRLFNAFYFKTDANGSFTSQEILEPWRKAWLGHRLWVQGAWADSKTGWASLTTAMTLTMPNDPANLPRRVSMFSFGSLKPSLSQSFINNPVMLFTYD